MEFSVGFSSLEFDKKRFRTKTIWGGGGGGAPPPPPPHMKGEAMLVVSLGGVDFSLRVFWAVKISFRVALQEILKVYIFSIRFIYSIHVIKVWNYRF